MSETTYPRPGASVLRGEELERLIDAILTDHLADLKGLMSDKPRYDGRSFDAEVAGLISVALADLGYCWARIPADHDDLWHGLHLSTSDTGRVNKLAMISDNEAVRKSAARTLAMKITSRWLETKTSVVKRRQG